MYSSSFAAGSVMYGPWPGQSKLWVGRPQALEGLQVGRQRAPVGWNEARAVAEHQVTAEADVADQEADVIGRVAGGRHDLEGADALGLAGDRDWAAGVSASPDASSAAPTSPKSSGASSIGAAAE